MLEQPDLSATLPRYGGRDFSRQTVFEDCAGAVSEIELNKDPRALREQEIVLQILKRAAKRPTRRSQRNFFASNFFPDNASLTNTPQ